MNDGDFLSQIEQTRQELVNERIAAWKDAEPVILKMIEDCGFPTSPNVRTTLLAIFQNVWVLGYHAGSGNMAMTMAKELGMGAVVDQVKIMKQTMKMKPENN